MYEQQEHRPQSGGEKADRPSPLTRMTAKRTMNHEVNA